MEILLVSANPLRQSKRDAYSSRRILQPAMFYTLTLTRQLLLPFLAAAVAVSAYAGPPPHQRQPFPAVKKSAPAAKSAKQEMAAAVTRAAKKGLPAKVRVQLATATPQPSGTPPQIARGEPFRLPQQQGDGPLGKTQAPGQKLHPSIPTPEELLPRVPASGPLNVEHLILLAIAKDGQLAIRRAQIAGAGAAREAAHDLRNPELRLSYSSENENQLELPYSEIIQRSFSPFPSQSYQEIDRLVTPGRDSDSYTFNNYDVFDDGVNPVSRTLTGTSYEQRSSTEVNNGGEQTGAMIRFSLPNPYERKARIQRASAEVLLAEAQYLADEGRLVREVLNLYESLSGYGSELDVHERRIANYRTMRSEMESAGDPSLAFEVARARSEMTGVSNDMREVKSDYEKVRIALAKLCGLREYTRIQSGSMVKRTIVNPSALDEAYLLDLAMIYRAVAVESTAWRDVAVARLAESKASGKLVATFIDVGWNGGDDNGRKGRNEEWFARLGISIPVWDLAKINKSSRAYARYAEEMQRALEIQREQISVDIHLALAELRMAAGLARQADGDLNEARREAEAIEDSLVRSLVNPKDIPKVQRHKYDNEDIYQKTRIGLIAAWSDYNKALHRLEDAIGTRIEKVLTR